MSTYKKLAVAAAAGLVAYTTSAYLAFVALTFGCELHGWCVEPIAAYRLMVALFGASAGLIAGKLVYDSAERVAAWTATKIVAAAVVGLIAMAAADMAARAVVGYFAGLILIDIAFGIVVGKIVYDRISGH